MTPRSLLYLLTVCTCLLSPSDGHAQGLVWRIPEASGRAVLYRGTYTQLIRRPDNPAGDLTLTWRRELLITALEEEEAEFNGAVVPCRWIEFRVITGPNKEGIIDAGPGGIRQYKILVPIEALQKVKIADDGSVIDYAQVSATHVPIVRGFRKIGNEEVAPLETPVFQIFPAISLLQHYPKLQQVEMMTVAGSKAEAARDPETGALQTRMVPTESTRTHHRGELVTEDSFTRSTNVGEIWLTTDPNVYFGLDRWLVTVTVEEKPSTASRSEFTVVSTITEEMAAEEFLQTQQTQLDVQ